MITEQVTFICDVCGRQQSISKEDYMSLIDPKHNGITRDVIPEGWRDMQPYGHTCTKCCEELDGVYNRIHAPIKAREEVYGHN